MSQLSTLLDPKLIEKQNKAFHRMSKKRQRIAIAEDVLKQIKASKYVATPGTYFASDEIDNLEYQHSQGDSEEDFDLQKALLGNAPQCDVCGIGAAFCSLARLGDDVSYHDDHHEELLPFFGEKQLALIETAFEGDEGVSPYHRLLSQEEIEDALSFYDKNYESAGKRLTAIFRNIVRNEGTFKP